MNIYIVKPNNVMVLNLNIVRMRSELLWIGINNLWKFTLRKQETKWKPRPRLCSKFLNHLGEPKHKSRVHSCLWFTPNPEYFHTVWINGTHVRDGCITVVEWLPHVPAVEDSNLRARSNNFWQDNSTMIGHWYFN